MLPAILFDNYLLHRIRYFAGRIIAADTAMHLRHHANIVQRVKTCYKIKIDSGGLGGCFYGVMLRKQHLCLTIAPLLHTNSATIRV